MTSSLAASPSLIDGLRARYRVAFAKWIVSRKALSGQPQGAEFAPAALSDEVAAARNYREARDQLADAMSSGEHVRVHAERGSAFWKLFRAARRGWGSDFWLILILTVLTVVFASLLANMVAGVR